MPGQEAGDIQQGKLGDCWFLAAMAAVADSDLGSQSIVGGAGDHDGMFPGQETLWQHGVCVVRFFDCSTSPATPFYVVVDDFVPVDRATRPNAEPKPVIVRPVGEWGDPSTRELWMVLLEKAFAKLCGSYSALSGGKSGDAHAAIKLMLGGEYNVRVELSRRVDGGNVGRRLGLETSAAGDVLTKEGFLMPAAIERRAGIENMPGGHVYTLVDALQAGADGQPTMVVRNPHGAETWRGEDPALRRRAEAKLIEAGLIKPNASLDSIGGVSVMPLADYTRLLDQTWVCSLGDSGPTPPAAAAAAAAAGGFGGGAANAPQTEGPHDPPRRGLTKQVTSSWTVPAGSTRREPAGGGAPPADTRALWEEQRHPAAPCRCTCARLAC
jgi:hypothetical protein